MKTPQLPMPELAKALGLTHELYFKREDKHKYFSHKGRSIPIMISEYETKGFNKFIISSSGNAALAALLYIQKRNQTKTKPPLALKILVGNKINAKKLDRLKKLISSDNIILEQIANPKQAAWQANKLGAYKLLRQSTDNTALVGYFELAAELAKINNLRAVFIPTSSGTTANGLYLGFKQLGLNPEIHIVQTDYCHPMVEGASSQAPSLASAIVDKIAWRKPAVLEAIKNSRGGGWIATNTKIVQAMKLVKDNAGISISPNSALAVVGLVAAIAAGRKWEGPVVCLITGE